MLSMVINEKLVDKKLIKILEAELCRQITSSDLTTSWEDLSIDSLGVIQLIREIEDEFILEIDINLFIKNIRNINQLIQYIEEQKQ